MPFLPPNQQRPSIEGNQQPSEPTKIAPTALLAGSLLTNHLMPLR